MKGWGEGAQTLEEVGDPKGEDPEGWAPEGVGPRKVGARREGVGGKATFRPNVTEFEI